MPGPIIPVAGGPGYVQGAVRWVRACDTASMCGRSREYEGQVLQRFTGHIARVSGVRLHNLGLPMRIIQILGRWSSLAILKCLQTAPLQMLPESAANARSRGPVGGIREDPWVLVQPAATDSNEVLVRDSDEELPLRAQRPRGRKRRAVDAGGHQRADRPVGAESDAHGLELSWS